MSELNLDTVRAQKEAIVLAQEVRELEQLQGLIDALESTNYWWNSSDPIIRGADWQSMLPVKFSYASAEQGDRRDGHFPPVYRTYYELQRIWEAARYLASSNPIVGGIFNHLSAYVIGSGFEYQVIARDGASERLVDRAQEVLDEFHMYNVWNEWEQELFIRSRRDGEYFLKFEPNDELLRVRTIEPEQVREPVDAQARNRDLRLNSKTSSWTYGVLTDRFDSLWPRGYWVVSQYTEQFNRGEFHSVEDIQHAKVNVDRTAKRGVSDLYAVVDDSEESRKLLRNIRKGATAQAAIAYIREHGGNITKTQVDALRSELTDKLARRMGPSEDSQNQYGRQSNMEGGSVLDVKGGTIYKPGPLGENSKLLDALQAALRTLGNTWGFPEGMSSGDWSNNNFASALIAEGPFVKQTVKAQMFYKVRWVQVMRKVLRHAQSAGVFRGLGQDVDLALDINVVLPNVAIRDRKAEVEADKMLVELGVMSKQTLSGKHDLDYDFEQEQLALDPVDDPDADTDEEDTELEGDE